MDIHGSFSGMGMGLTILNQSKPQNGTNWMDSLQLDIGARVHCYAVSDCGTSDDST